MEANDRDSYYLLLVKMGVGKSTLSKIISEEVNIKIGNSIYLKNNKVNSYKCQLDNFTFSVIDTQGYDKKIVKFRKLYDKRKFLNTYLAFKNLHFLIIIGKDYKK